MSMDPDKMSMNPDKMSMNANFASEANSHL
jgi:hypothetical protein